MNHNANICVFWWSRTNPCETVFQSLGGHDPQAENTNLGNSEVVTFRNIICTYLRRKLCQQQWIKFSFGNTRCYLINRKDFSRISLVS